MNMYSPSFFLHPVKSNLLPHRISFANQSFRKLQTMRGHNDLSFVRDWGKTKKNKIISFINSPPNLQ